MNGKGRPQGLSGQKISLVSRTAFLAQVIDVFNHLGGPERAIRAVKSRKGSWFDPELVDSFLAFSNDPDLWKRVQDVGLQERVQALEPSERFLSSDDQPLDRVAEDFARIIDAKSPYTHDHSREVAHYGELLGVSTGLSRDQTNWIRKGLFLTIWESWE